MTIAVMIVSASSATAPSISSLCGSCRHSATASPITSGATMMMPITSDANQCCQLVSISADGPERTRYVTAPPIPEIAVPTTAAMRRPITWRSRSSAKSSPK